MGTSAQPENAGGPFVGIKPDRIKEILEKATPALVKTTRKFIEGDHWQGGAGWAGPMLPISHPKYNETLELLRKRFVSKNVIAEVAERHMSGVVGREPSWDFTPRREITDAAPITPEEEADIAAIGAVIKEWWDKRGIHRMIQEATMRLLWGKRSPARMYVPRGLLEPGATGATGSINARSIREALDKIHVEAVEHEMGTVFEDPDTKERLGIYSILVGQRTVSFLTYLEPGGEIGETPEQDKPRRTVWVTLDGDVETITGPFEFGGRLTMFEMTRPLLVTQQVQEAQRAINFAVTMIPRAIETSGFLERVITNAQINGRMEKDPLNPDGPPKFIADPPIFGPGMTTFLEGLKSESRDGGVQPTQPGVHYRTPSPITPIIDAKRSHYEDALEEADQSHILIAGEATPSGKSREEARADYRDSLKLTESTATEFVRWILETALAMAEAFSGKTGEWTTKYRASVTLRVSTGKPSVEERKQNNEDVEKGTLSRLSAMEAADIADPDAELARMDMDPLSSYGREKALGEALLALTEAGASFEGAARRLGIEEDEIRELLESTIEVENVNETDPDGGDPEDTPAREDDEEEEE
jgi:hypothetical protein